MNTKQLAINKIIKGFESSSKYNCLPMIF